MKFKYWAHIIVRKNPDKLCIKYVSRTYFHGNYLSKFKNRDKRWLQLELSEPAMYVPKMPF